MVTNVTNEKERLHHSRFPDSGGSLEFVLPGKAESALLRNIACRRVSQSSSENLQRFILSSSLTKTRIRHFSKRVKETYCRSAVRKIR